jgi:hypothetical protein
MLLNPALEAHSLKKKNQKIMSTEQALGVEKDFIHWPRMEKREPCSQISFSRPEGLSGYNFGMKG